MTAPMQPVPWQQLTPDALRGIILDVITREGTDVHDSDTFDPEDGYQKVLAKLKRDDLILVFDQESGTCAIVSPDALDS